MNDNKPKTLTAQSLCTLQPTDHEHPQPHPHRYDIENLKARLARSFEKQIYYSLAQARLEDSKLPKYLKDAATRYTTFRDLIRSSKSWLALQHPPLDELAKDFCEHIIQPFINELQVHLVEFYKASNTAVIISRPKVEAEPERVHNTEDEKNEIKGFKSQLDARWPGFMESLGKHKDRNQEFKVPILDTYLFDEFYELLKGAGTHSSDSRLFPCKFIALYGTALQSLTVMLDHVPGEDQVS